MEIKLQENNKPSLLWKNVCDKSYYITPSLINITKKITSKKKNTPVFNKKSYFFTLKVLGS